MLHLKKFNRFNNLLLILMNFYPKSACWIIILKPKLADTGFIFILSQNSYGEINAKHLLH